MRTIGNNPVHRTHMFFILSLKRFAKCVLSEIWQRWRGTPRASGWLLGSVAKSKHRTPNQLPRDVYRVSRVAQALRA